MNNVYGLTPINGTASVVTNQKGCTNELTPKQERENLISHVQQVEALLMTLPKGSKERKSLGLKKLDFCNEIRKLNEKMSKFSIGIDGRDAFVDCVFAVMKEQLTDFQYKNIMRLSRELYSSDLKEKSLNND
tara:strand:+ start:128 stop:523 length:396 start_codon:yes stop_codon:yes gene_type:complete